MNNGLQLGFSDVSRVKLIRQTEISECGLACLAMIASYYRLNIDLGTLRRRFPPSIRGTSLKNIITTADSLGFTSRALKLDLENLKNLQLPAILHWDMNHYVVLEKIEKKRYIIYDPALGLQKLRLEDCSGHFTGVALELTPSAEFQPANKQDTFKISDLWHNVRGFKRALLQTLILSLLLEVFVLVSPYYMQIALDQVLPATDNNLLVVLFTGFGLFTLLMACASVLRSFVLLSVGTSLSYGVAVNLARRLFRLPVDWFEKRHVGDILSRFQSIVPIQQALTQGAVAAVLDGMLAFFTLAMMFLYSNLLAWVAVGACGLYLIVRLISFAYERSAKEHVIISGSKEQSMMIESLRGITTLRLFNKEALRHALWQTKLTDSTNASLRLARIGIWQSSANTLIVGLESLCTIALAIHLVMQGGFSIGMVFAYIAYKTQFLTKSSSSFDYMISFKMLGLHLERLSDIAKTPEDVGIGSKLPTGIELKGNISLRDIFYRYSPSDPFILSGLNLDVQAGEHIAITGPSGGGKSTLAKIMLGLLSPDSGEILVDGKPLERFGHKNYHDQISAVLQDDVLFAGTIADNIALFDESQNIERIIVSAAAAAIHEDIMAMPMGYETLVGDMGSTLSGGQKQRIFIARALYREPKMLIMDESSSHLDAEREHMVNRAIASLGITRIVIAHREETICAADKVYLLQNGTLNDVSSDVRKIPVIKEELEPVIHGQSVTPLRENENAV